MWLDLTAHVSCADCIAGVLLACTAQLLQDGAVPLPRPSRCTVGNQAIWRATVPPAPGLCFWLLLLCLPPSVPASLFKIKHRCPPWKRPRPSEHPARFLSFLSISFCRPLGLLINSHAVFSASLPPSFTVQKSLWPASPALTQTETCFNQRLLLCVVSHVCVLSPQVYAQRNGKEQVCQSVCVSVCVVISHFIKAHTTQRLRCHCGTCPIELWAFIEYFPISGY